MQVFNREKEQLGSSITEKELAEVFASLAPRLKDASPEQRGILIMRKVLELCLRDPKIPRDVKNEIRSALNSHDSREMMKRAFRAGITLPDSGLI